jgi:hypothetical protein
MEIVALPTANSKDLLNSVELLLVDVTLLNIAPPIMASVPATSIPLAPPAQMTALGMEFVFPNLTNGLLEMKAPVNVTLAGLDLNVTSLIAMPSPTALVVLLTQPVVGVVQQVNVCKGTQPNLPLEPVMPGNSKPVAVPLLVDLQVPALVAPVNVSLVEEDPPVNSILDVMVFQPPLPFSPK